MPGYVRSRLSYTAPVDRSMDVDFMMSLMRSDNRFADAFARYDSGGAGGRGGGDDTNFSPATCRWGRYCHRGTNFLTKKYVGPTFRWGLSLGNVLPSSLPHQLFPSDMSLGKHIPSEMSLAK
ncbi:hypothetical protein Tco_0148592, partial [Tanacetum coccineum]